MSIQTPLIDRLRKTRRAAEILKVLVHHGFASFVQHSGLSSLIEGGLEKAGLGRGGPAHITSEALRLRRAMEELGATFIKLGQILSCRPDLVPEEYAAEFAKLQSDAPRVSFDAIRERLNQAFPDGPETVFASIEEIPLAAASIAQVHRATLLDGTQVVIKVMRPGAEEQFAGDVAVLADLARFVEHHFSKLGFAPTRVAEEFARQIERELDFVQEARATRRLGTFFADDDGVHFPRVFEQASTRRVLTLEEIHGVQLSSVDPAELEPLARAGLCQHGATAVFRMCLEFGFFHADPHPGNLFVLPDGSVCFIDCGMTGHMDARSRMQIGLFVRAVLEADLERCVRLVIELSGADPTLETDRAFRNEVWELVTRFETTSLAGLDLVALLQQFFELLRRRQIVCPADLVYLIKALTTIEGVAEQVDPEFDVIAHVRGLLRRLYSRRFVRQVLRDRVTRAATGYVEMLEQLPAELRQLLVQFRRRDFSVRLSHDGLDELERSILRTGRFVALALVMSAVLLGSAILIHGEASRGQVGVFTWVGSLTLLASLAFVGYLTMSMGRR